MFSKPGFAVHCTTEHKILPACRGMLVANHAQHRMFSETPHRIRNGATMQQAPALICLISYLFEVLKF